MKSSGFYKLTFQFVSDFKFTKLTLVYNPKPLFFIYFVGNSYFFVSANLIPKAINIPPVVLSSHFFTL